MTRRDGGCVVQIEGVSRRKFAGGPLLDSAISRAVGARDLFRLGELADTEQDPSPEPSGDPDRKTAPCSSALPNGPARWSSWPRRRPGSSSTTTSAPS